MQRAALLAIVSLLISSFISCAGDSDPVATPATQVQTDSGMLAGKVLDSGVKAWSGIPFARPPVRELRWKEPQPITWEGIYNADRKMPECIQTLRAHNINHYFGDEPTSEDCLYMNIWAPPDSDANSKLPVIVFIYGGGYNLGSSGMANYDGEQAAIRGAVFVNFNYRVGTMGFMAHPELTAEQGGHSGNYGFLDQNVALKWINRNIDKFGGDTSKLIISGQSAGAGSVVEQIFSPLSKGLFRGAVMMSGCNWTREVDLTRPYSLPLAEAEKTGLAIQKLLNAASLDDMRQIPADRILTVQIDSRSGLPALGLTVGPTIDGYFAPKSKTAILEAHEINDIPIIASLTHDEAGIELKQAKTVAEYKAIAAKMFGAAAGEFLNLYPVSSDADIRLMAQTAANEAPGSFGLYPACDCGRLQAKYNQSPTFITLYSRKHPYVPGVKIADQDIATIGAYHTSEVPYYFGNFDAYNLFRPTRNWTPWDYEMSQKMTASLIAFANTGNPSTPDINWPAWTAENEQYVNFGDEIKLEKVNRSRLDFMARNMPEAAVPAPRPAGSARD